MASGGSIQLSPAERGAYAHFFALADPQNTGVVSGNNAVSFFALSGLHPTVLGVVWEMSDRDQNGFLTPAHFSIALRLIGHAQGGKVLTEDLLNQAGPMPSFKGVTLPAHLAAAGASAAQGPASPSTPSRQASALMPQVTGGSFSSGATVGEIRPEDRARYTRIFASAGPQAGLIDGEKAKNIFVKSKLPFDQLGQIWNLADTKARGQLDLTDFTIGMHFIQCTMGGSLKKIPATLPSGLYEKAASGASVAPISAPMTPQATGGSTSGMLPRQFTGSQFSPSPGSPAQSHLRSASGIPSSLQPQRTGTFSTAGSQHMANAGAPWAVIPSDKAKADSFFDGLDQDKKGVLDGAVAVPFFLQSGLGEATLAHVWDLSDITQSGSLSRDEFAVAMHLINAKLTGTELPQELPAALIPPSLRGQSLPQAVDPQQTDTQKDLFSLMDDDIDLPVSAATAFAVPAPAAAAAAPSTQSRSAGSRGAFDSAFDDDFLGSETPSAKPIVSTMGAPGGQVPPVLSPQATGTSTTSRAAEKRSVFPVSDASTDAANHRLALESTQKSLGGLESEKADLQRNISSDADTVADLKTRLETVRMRHQTESEAVSALRQRFTMQASELKRLREESVHEESELSRLKAEKDELEQALMKDREDVREFNRVVSERNKEKETLKAEIEKIKKDSRQQKGLLAIGKKQVSQAESDVDKAREELEHARLGETEARDASEHATHGEVPLPAPAEPTRASIASPALSTRSYNPFDRLTPNATGVHAAPGTGGVLGAAALGGATAAGIGAAAYAHHSSEKTEPAAKTAQEKADEDDPFGMSTQQLRSGAQSSAADDFDDAFGQDEGEHHGSAQVPSATDSSHAFDDAFAEMDGSTSSNAPITGTKEPASAEDSRDQPAASSAASVPDELESQSASVGPPGAFSPPIETKEQDRDHIASKLPSSQVDPGEGLTGAMQPMATYNDSALEPSAVEKGKGVLHDADEDDLSSDEDEGPEDIESKKRAFGSSPQVGNVDEQPISTDVGTGGVETSKDFPLHPQGPDTGISSSIVHMAPAVAPLPGSTDLSRVHSASGVSESDAFHDAPSESTPVAPLGSQVAQPLTHDRFATATEEPQLGTIRSASQRSTSPAKTRRAPPAVPSRGPGFMSGSETSAMAPTHTLDGATTAATGAGSNINTAQHNPMDDFDAAFEDLGPASSNGGTVNAGDVSHSHTSGTGFDDTFADADGFDFVPSFSSNNLAPANSQITREAPQSSTRQDAAPHRPAAPPGAFQGFDSAFELSPFDAGSNGMENRAGHAAGQQTNTSSSGAGSGFSFEDAFVPVEGHGGAETAAPLTGAPSGASAITAIPPPAPPRNAARASRGTSGGTGTSMTTPANTDSAGAGALPDDAGPVKQLCQMGFSRADVIKALERSNYRTEKALERLLSQA